MKLIFYNNIDFFFTLDDSNFLAVETENDDTFFTLQLIVKFYYFYDNVQQTKELNYKIPLFNKQASFNIGRKIHRQINSIQNLNAAIFEYKTTLVDIVLKEYNFNDLETEVSSETVNNVKFIYGILPEKIENNIALLTANTNHSRITPVGSITCSFLLPEGNHTLEILKNNEVVGSENIVATATDNVITRKINASSFNAVDGDEFMFSIRNTTVLKKITVFEAQKLSNTLLFLDEFKLLNSIECTGEFSFPTSYKQISHKYKRNWVEITEIIDTKKENSFKINTGWLLKTDHIIIDSLLMHKKAWLFINDIEVIELVPSSKKITNIESEKEYYEYDLEFKINRTYDAQNYTL